MTLVRRATADDVPAVLALEHRLFGADAWSERAVHDELTSASREALVAEDGEGRIVGYVVLLGNDEVVDLQRIAVEPAHRRRGVAGALLDACDVPPCARMLLEVRADNAPAQSFYRARGFLDIARRRRYYTDGCDAVVMERSPRDDEDCPSEGRA